MARTFKFGLLGHNISYSKSADIFNTIFELNKINGSFENFDLPVTSFENEFEKIIKSGVDGLSVTIPFKSTVMPLLAEINPIAKALNAVNSIAVTNRVLYGYNTDVAGFSMPLAELAEKLKNGRALILGCGGSARAVIYALYADYEITDFLLLGRNEAKLRACRDALKEILLNAKIKTMSFAAFEEHPSDSFSIIVNCTPLGGWNHGDKSPLPKTFSWSNSKIYYDLNYNDNNQVLRAAQKSGLKVFDGSRMLVGQGIRSFEIWTGGTADFESVYARVFADKLQNSREGKFNLI